MLSWLTQNYPHLISYLIFAVFVVALVLWFVSRKSNVDKYEYYHDSLGVKEVEDDEDDDEEELDLEESFEPEIVSLGNWTVYPVCPHCNMDMKNVLLVWNKEESENFNDGEICVVLCSCCKKPVPISVDR